MRKSLALVPLLVGACLLGSPVAQASTSDAIGDAVARVADGTYTKADLVLIRTDPEVAATVPDPEAPATATTESSGGRKATSTERTKLARIATSTELATTTYCGAYRKVTYTQKSLLGSVIYAYTTYTEWCRTGYKVLSWTTRYEYLSKTSSVIYWQENVVNQQYGLGTNTAVSHFQHHIEYCTISKYVGCYANTYPWVRTVAHGDGTSSYTGSKQ